MAVERARLPRDHLAVRLPHPTPSRYHRIDPTGHIDHRLIDSNARAAGSSGGRQLWGARRRKIGGPPPCRGVTCDVTLQAGTKIAPMGHRPRSRCDTASQATGARGNRARACSGCSMAACRCEAGCSGHHRRGAGRRWARPPVARPHFTVEQPSVALLSQHPLPCRRPIVGDLGVWSVVRRTGGSR